MAKNISYLLLEIKILVVEKKLNLSKKILITFTNPLLQPKISISKKRASVRQEKFKYNLMKQLSLAKFKN